MKILGLIPARGGSKGVPGKNIKSLAGKPLLAYTAEAALQAKRLDKVVISTEDVAIAEVARAYGIEVPFMRPEELALDTTPTLPAVQHALQYFIDQGTKYDAVCLLQPTNPLRRASDIDGAIALFEQGHFDCVVSTLPVPHEYNPHWVFFQDGDGKLTIATGDESIIPRRQALPAAFHREGSIYISSFDTVMNHNSLYGSRMGGYEIQGLPLVNIDTQADWDNAEQMIRNFLSTTTATHEN